MSTRVRVSLKIWCARVPLPFPFPLPFPLHSFENPSYSSVALPRRLRPLSSPLAPMPPGIPTENGVRLTPSSHPQRCCPSANGTIVSKNGVSLISLITCRKVTPSTYRGRFLSLHDVLDVAGTKAIAYGGLEVGDVT